MFRPRLMIAACGVAALAVTGCDNTSFTSTSDAMTSTVTWQQDGMPYHTPTTTDADWHYQFVHFPVTNTYFEPFTKTWYWQENGAWMQGGQLPTHFTPMANDATIVKVMTTDAMFAPPMTESQVVMTGTN